jgi:hypothetical protein
MLMYPGKQIQQKMWFHHHRQRNEDWLAAACLLACLIGSLVGSTTMLMRIYFGDINQENYCIFWGVLLYFQTAQILIKQYFSVSIRILNEQ